MDYAKKNNMTIVGQYTDRAVSATSDNRPEFQRMIADSDNRLFDAVLVWKLDRFSRNRYDSATYKAKLRKNGVRVISVMENISNNPEGILVESLLEGMAEYYSAELSQKVSRGMRETAMKCHSVGGATPLGYKVTNGVYSVDEDSAPVVRKIFEMYADAVPPSVIIKWLNDKGFRTSKKKPFVKTSLKCMLNNKRYKGIYTYRDMEIPDGMPRIIDDLTFERVQKMIESNQKIGAHYGAKHESLLATKLFCGNCKKMMFADCGTGTSQIYHYYTCSERKNKKGTCRKASVRQDYLDDVVIDAISSDVMDNIERIAKRYTELQKEPMPEDAMHKAYKAKLAGINKSIDNIMNAIEAGIFTDSTKSRLQELEAQKASVERDISASKTANVLYNEDVIVEMLKMLKSDDTKSAEYRRRVVDALVGRVYLYDDKVVIIYTFTKNDPNYQSIIDRIDNSDSVSNGGRTLSVSEFCFFCLGLLVSIRRVKTGSKK